MSGLLTGKVALITGGASGIGAATARRFAAEGAHVVIADLDEKGGKLVLDQLPKGSGAHEFIRVDVTEEAAVEKMIARIVSGHHSLDVAFNNAGIGGLEGPLHEMTVENWDNVLKVNLRSIFLCLKHELRQMIQQKSGVILNNSSVAGLVSCPMASPYAASKFGVTALTETAAVEVARLGIRVNSVCPGFIRTPFHGGQENDPEFVAKTGKLHPLGRMGVPEDIANAAAWVCSEQAAFVTGHSLVIDGGLIARSYNPA